MPGAVFLSYASQDSEAGRRIYEALGAAGIEVWFDRSELRGGDVWDRRIREQIHQCKLFMPIISANTEARVEGYFRREWKLAVERTHDRSERVAFLVPVVIDSTAEQLADVPDAFRHVQWTRLPNGETPQGLVDRIRRLLTPEGSFGADRARVPVNNVVTGTLSPPGVTRRQRIQYVRAADGTRLAWVQRGAFRRGDVAAQRAYRAMVELAETSWEASNSLFRQVFTSRFIPGASPEQLQWFNELCTKSTVGEVAGKLMHARAEVDIGDLLPRVRTPTLVLHSRNDEVVPISEGQCLATEIEGAEFIELDSRNHVLLEHEPAWFRFQEEVLAFVR